MKIVITLKELQDKHDWERVCVYFGLNPHCLNEGGGECGETIEMSKEQAIELGIIKG